MFKDLIRQKEHMVLPDLAQDLAQVSHTPRATAICVSLPTTMPVNVTNYACKGYQPCL